MVKTTEQSVDERIGANIRDARVDAGLSQSELAKAAASASGLDWSERLVARMESGGRPLRYSEATILAQVLAVPVSAFSDGTTDTVRASARMGRLQRALKDVVAATTPLIDAWSVYGTAQVEYMRALRAVDHEELATQFNESDIDSLFALGGGTYLAELGDAMDKALDTWQKSTGGLRMMAERKLAEARLHDTASDGADLLDATAVKPATRKPRKKTDA